MQSLSRGPYRETYVGVHKSLGVTILFLMLARLLWRAWHRSPPLPQSMSPFMSLLAKSSHWTLYVLFVGMPISGYVLSAAGGHPVPFFGLFDLPALPRNTTLAHDATFVHNTLRWLVYALILGHVGATVWHVAWRRDGALERMLPAQTES
jgi:cytochrome b561